MVEIVNNDANEEVECEEGAEDDKDDEVYVHVEVDLIRRLLLYLKQQNITSLGFFLKSFTCYNMFKYNK